MIANLAKVMTEPLAPEFDALFREHYQLIYRTAYGVTGRAEDADDIAQTVFLRLMRRQFPPDLTKNPRGYLYRAAVNLSLNLVQSRRSYVSASDFETPAVESSVEAIDSAEEAHRRLYEAIGELPPRAAEILILRYVHGKSDADIAKMLGTSRGTIAVNLYRSRARLKKILRASQGERS